MVCSAARRMGRTTRTTTPRSQWILTWIICARHIYSWEHVHVVRFSCNFDYSPSRAVADITFLFDIFFVLFRIHTQTPITLNQLFHLTSIASTCETTSVIGTNKSEIWYNSDWYRNGNESVSLGTKGERRICEFVICHFGHTSVQSNQRQSSAESNCVIGFSVSSLAICWSTLIVGMRRVFVLEPLQFQFGLWIETFCRMWTTLQIASIYEDRIWKAKTVGRWLCLCYGPNAVLVWSLNVVKIIIITKAHGHAHAHAQRLF